MYPGIFIGQCNTYVQRGFSSHQIKANQPEKDEIHKLFDELVTKIAEEIAKRSSMQSPDYTDYVKANILKVHPLRYDVLGVDIPVLYRPEQVLMENEVKLRVAMELDKQKNDTKDP